MRRLYPSLLLLATLTATGAEPRKSQKLVLPPPHSTRSPAAEITSARAGVTIPSADEVQAMVPGQGKLGERDLILLALASRPELEKLRGSVTVATAKERAAHDLPNPEFRLSYAEDQDDRIGAPYKETESLTGSATETFNSTTSTTSAVTPTGEPGYTGTTFDRESGTTRTNRTRTIERQVTPGATEDVVVERVYEESDSSTNSRRNRNEIGKNGKTTNSVDGQRERGNRRLVSESRRVIKHPDASGRDNEWGFLLRFTLPHPWERKARIKRAAAEISLAEADYYAEEDKVVRIVRGTYQDLALLESQLGAENKRKAGYESHRDWIEQQKNPKLGLELASSRSKIYKSLADVRDLETEISATREDLAAYCGLQDPSRIQISATRRQVEQPSSLDADYLTNMAMLYRSDVLNNQARLVVARAQLAEAKAARIPFATFLDLGYSQVDSLGRLGANNQWLIRMGFSLPLWDWIGINKKRKVFEADSMTLERQIELQRGAIYTEVTQALKRLKSAQEQLARFDTDIAALRADQKKSMQDAQLATIDVNDILKGKRIEYEFEDLAHGMDITRYKAFAAYNQALMALEKALGIRLERVLKATH